MILNDQTAIETSKKLLQINAIKLNPKNPFIWASGINSPIYCDNRLILSEIETRKYICNELCVLINKKFKRTEVIAGVATGAIGMGMMVAQQLNKPFIYNSQVAAFIFINKNTSVLYLNSFCRLF